MIIEGLMMVLIIILAVKVWRNADRLDLINEEVEDWIADARELKQRCDGHKELIEALSKSVRELNGVVEAAVKDKEETSDNKPDTKALIGGWTTDDAETTWLDDVLAKIRKEEAKPIDASHISTGTIMMWHGRFVNECGRLADGTVVWGDKDGRLYVGDAELYEMDQ